MGDAYETMHFNPLECSHRLEWQRRWRQQQTLPTSTDRAWHMGLVTQFSSRLNSFLTFLCNVEWKGDNSLIVEGDNMVLWQWSDELKWITWFDVKFKLKFYYSVKITWPIGLVSSRMKMFEEYGVTCDVRQGIWSRLKPGSCACA